MADQKGEIKSWVDRVLEAQEGGIANVVREYDPVRGHVWETKREEPSFQALQKIFEAKIVSEKAYQAAAHFYERFFLKKQKTAHHSDDGVKNQKERFLNIILGSLATDVVVEQIFKTHCNRYRFFIDNFAEKMKKDEAFQEMFFGRFNQFIKSNENLFKRYPQTSSNKGPLKNEEKGVEQAVRRLRVVLVELPRNDVGKFVSPKKGGKYETVLTEVNGTYTAAGKIWLALGGLFFAPITLVEWMCCSHYGQRFFEKNSINSLWKVIGDMLKAIFWPEALIKAFPEWKWTIRCMHFVPWVVLAIFIPPLFGTSIEFLPEFFEVIPMSMLKTFSLMVSLAYVGARMIWHGVADSSCFKVISKEPTEEERARFQRSQLFDFEYTSPGRSAIVRKKTIEDGGAVPVAKRKLDMDEGAKGGVVSKEAKGDRPKEQPARPLAWWARLCCGGGSSDPTLTAEAAGGSAPDLDYVPGGDNRG